jgi:uncharacterized protein with NRDE domain
MCTAILLRRPGHAWPLIFAGNRDEMRDRPWQPPARHWPDRPELVAGLDETSGTSWGGVNDWGVTAAVLNRYGSLGRDPAKRSRGELVLEALDHAEAREAARALADLEPAAYRSFNLVVADAREAYWVRNLGDAETPHGKPPERVGVQAIPQGLHMLTAWDLNDQRCPRIFRYVDRFLTAPHPDPDADDWTAWQALLADAEADPPDRPTAAMCFETESGFATLSSSLIALPAPPQRLDQEPHPAEFLFAPGPPCTTAFAPVAA